MQEYTDLHPENLLHLLKQKDFSIQQVKTDNRQLREENARLQQSVDWWEKNFKSMKESLDSLTAERSRWVRALRRKGIQVKDI